MEEIRYQRNGVHRRTLHLVKMINDDGQMSPYCADPPRPLDRETELPIQSERFHDDVNCESCRELAGLGEAKVSRMYILLQNVALMMDFERLFWDAHVWNTEARQPGEAPINPDPDGVVAANWLRLRTEFDTEIDKMKNFMERHEGQFGWPEEMG